VLPEAVRAFLELRVQEEEEQQQQQLQEGYYFEGMKRAVYVVEEVRAASAAVGRVYVCVWGGGGPIGVSSWCYLPVWR
jgi:hypothetical protein